MKGDPVALGEDHSAPRRPSRPRWDSAYEWLNKAIFIGVAERKSDAAIGALLPRQLTVRQYPFASATIALTSASRSPRSITSTGECE